MTAAIVAMLYLRGNFRMACQFLGAYDDMPHRLRRSRFNRRLHRISELYLTLFLALGEYWKVLNARSSYVLDSYPIAACDNDRIPRCKRYQGEAWHGYIASKKRFFYGVRGHILITESGQPVEFFLAPGVMRDTLDVPEGSWLTGDKAYTDDTIEDVLHEVGVERLPIRKTHSHRPLPPFFTDLQASVRKMEINKKFK